ncbi:MAG: hypothetical protein HON53_21035 [Planctomycetaceae bacterium]|nr:hypothetical protein [Planctomycetaceae bacterium]MBT6155877.1 hypothetical protein [Planctomycetaceae bacterium]MBT6484263.1 hypothetical protein [Planctomycetaceae bacterium]MBT6498069.1 hypothetical protein [Planctomycetaceae bacterium]
MRIVFVGVLAVSGLAGLIGCGTSVDEEFAAGGEATALLDRTDSANAAQADRAENVPLYGAEPLVPAIQLDGEPAGDFGPIVGSSTGGTFPVSMGLNTGILAPDFTADPRAAFHPHGPQVCASGCAASNHATPELSRNEFQQLLARYEQGPLDETNAALEALLFYGRQSTALLRQLSPSSPMRKHDEFLRRELKKTHAVLSFRIVDEQGIVRVEMTRTRVPLDRRHVFDMKTQGLQPLVTSGTVKRVGLHHLWTRL